MKKLPFFLVLCLGVPLSGCRGGSATSGSGDVLESEDGQFRVLGTQTDLFDFGRAKSLAEDAITRYPDLGCMVGLFVYNGPKCLEAASEAGKLGKIQIVAFDEDDATLQGIADGDIYGTIVQDPYRYGYESVRILSHLVRGDRTVLPSEGFLNIPARSITKENVRQFREELDRLMAPKEAPKDADSNRPTFAFITNGIAGFWDKAKKGAEDAAIDFNVAVEVLMPADGVADQTRIVQDLLTRGIDGIAISPIDADNQVDLLDQISEKTLLITHDSDAPGSKRLCYVGMENYDAGLLCGAMVREAMPRGGSVMLFIGRLEQDNARQRQQGTIDAILGRSRSNAGSKASAGPASAL